MVAPGTPKDDATTTARTRLQEALRRMNNLALASANRPELESDYQAAVAAVAAAESELEQAKEEAFNG